MQFLPAFVLGLLIGTVGGVVLSRFLLRRNTDALSQQMRESFTALSADALRQSTEQLSKMAESKLNEHLKLGEKNLDSKKSLIDQNLNDMKQYLNKVEKLMHDIDKQSAHRFGSLDARLGNAADVIGKLQNTTEGLRNALSNTKGRGQWGERMAEDVLRLAGFVEGINYVKQKSIDAGTSRPDFTFLLPQDRMLNMDVKFPFDNYELYLNAETEAEKEKFKAQFLRDVRNRIKELRDRAYINPDENTVDYVLLFIPNEQIYCFINEMDRTIVDEALKHKTILCSPMTLYAVLALIHQSIQNFMLENRSKEFQAFYGAFNQQWQKFKEIIAKVGDKLRHLQNEYDELSGPRMRQLEKPLMKIEQLRQENGIEVAQLPSDEEILTSFEEIASDNIEQQVLTEAKKSSRRRNG